MADVRSLNYLSTYLVRLIKGKLWLQVIVALLLGIFVGILFNPTSGIISANTSEQMAQWFDLPGTIFMKLVQMVMIPLIFSSIISGIINNTGNNLKTMGLRLLIYFVFTTIIAIVIGAVVTLLMKPGLMVYELGGFPNSKDVAVDTVAKSVSFNTIPDAIANLVPNNPLESMLSGEMLGVVVFTIIIGVAITQLNQKTTRPIINAIQAIQKICMIIISWAMLLVPFAVFGMMVALLSRIGLEVLVGLAYYMSVVLIGLFFLLLVYLLILVITTRSNPLRFLSAIKEAQLLAFSTASSAAVMPLSMKIADEKLKVDSSVSDFVIPIGATINMDGTALFQCVTALFIAQSYGIEMSIFNLLLITFTIVGASIGTPSIPGGGVIILASVLQSTGIPTDGLIVIIGIDRILGMFRTAVNVTGDLVACVVFDKWFTKPIHLIKKPLLTS